MDDPSTLRAAPARPVPRLLEPSDEVLVARARDGDHEAFRALYRRYVQRTYAQLTRLIGPSEDREDLVQQVFLAFHCALPKYRGEAPVGAFLHGIVTRVAYEALRKRKRTPTQQVREADFAQLLSTDLTPEAQARQQQALLQLHQALARLKPKKRIAFVLHAIEGLSLTEIAALTKSQPRTVGQRVASARKELERMLVRAKRIHGRGEA